MPQNVFVGRVARSYDANSAAMNDPGVIGPTVAFLAGLAGDGAALEFAIGTGRVALGLHERGIEVHGIEISQDMVAVLRNKPGGDSIPVTIGDMATTRLERTFQLVYLVYNTIGNLLTQAEQVACFRNAAAHLAPGGSFVIEVGVPTLRNLPPGQHAYPFDVSEHHLGFDTYDFVDQQLTSHHYWTDSEGNIDRFASHHRYVWPAELDLMAELAGMSRQERWADWTRAPFTGESTSHVSVWKRA
jgi:SAM-dependent methyltransferase